jgi:CRISPR-associated protein Cas1
MLPHALRDLPKIRDSISFVYFAYGRVEQTKMGVEFVNEQGRTIIPVASVTSLLLGPGTTVTHAAVQSLAKAGCLVVWCGEGGVRFYAQGLGETQKAYKLLRQARLASDEEARLRVVERMYRMRFAEPIAPGTTLQQIRGKEGARVRQAYREAADRYGVQWNGRRYHRGDWGASDAPNRALSAANACLNGVCHAAIVSAGYSPGLGFIHQGKQLAFVYDVADLYKAEITIPAAFESAAKDPEARSGALETTVRKRCRDLFGETKLLGRIVGDIERLLDLDKDLALPDAFDPDDDPALPTPWWTPVDPAIFGGGAESGTDAGDQPGGAG